MNQHKPEIVAFLTDKNIDVMLIAETHLTDKHNFCIPGYKFYKTNHPDGKAHGGTGVLIRNRIKHYVRPVFAEKFLQATSITLQCQRGDLTLSAIYCPPRFSITAEKFCEFFRTLGDKFFAAGDFNAKHTHWGSRLINPKGRQLYRAIISPRENLDFKSPCTPTYWPTDRNKIPDLIDFAIIKGLHRNMVSSEALFDLSSDHSPVLFTLFENPKNDECESHLTSSKTDWLKYTKFISSHIHTNPNLECEEDIEYSLHMLNSLMITAAEHSTPLTQSSHRSGGTVLNS